MIYHSPTNPRITENGEEHIARLDFQIKCAATSTGKTPASYPEFGSIVNLYFSSSFENLLGALEQLNHQIFESHHRFSLHSHA